MRANISEVEDFDSKIFEEYHCFIFENQLSNLEATIALVL
jgi:hypothetical protein